MMTTPRRRPSSPAWGQGRALLLAAARGLFDDRGYDTVTTREIAERAGVSEQMVFRHFGSKAKLFEAAALAPFIEHLDHYVSEWERRPWGVRDPVQEAVDLYRGLYDVFTTNRTLLAALVSYEDKSSDIVAVTLAPALDRFSDLLRTEQQARGFRDFDTSIVVRLVAGLAMSQCLFADLMYLGSKVPLPTAEAVVREMAMLTIYGAWPAASFRGGAPE